MMRAVRSCLFSRKGYAMLWAVCVMFVVVVISAGILLAGHMHYEITADEARSTKAELLARSGAVYAKQRITECDAMGDSSWCPDEDAFLNGINSMQPRTVFFDGDKRSDNCAVISYEIIDNGDDHLLKVVSSACIGNAEEECCGIYTCEGAGIWRFIGYTD